MRPKYQGKWICVCLKEFQQEQSLHNHKKNCGHNLSSFLSYG